MMLSGGEYASFLIHCFQHTIPFLSLILSVLLRSTDHRSLVIFLDMKKTGSKSRAATKKETKEALKPVDDRKVGKRKAAPPKTEKKKAKKETKGKKDPNKPKRPPSAFFVFLEEFRKTFKKENPNVKAVSAVGKAGGEKWKSLSAAEKAPYEAKAAKKKAEYEKLMNAYNKKQDSSDDEGDEGSEKSTSEIHDDEEGSVQEAGDDDDDDDDEDEDDDDEDDDEDDE
ncbi:High mobility group B protein 1 [Striga hermonthica]|uniref:High mobility group B protein 1 n=1 Tax=Striga hermonthica TaxID=68872 RepID=A0A9N7NUF1_STRHE|nr:High mobility group B protein 1 [Striga hermonthica]